MKAHVKQFDPTEVKVGGNTFFLFPFPAFKAANITGELTAVITPILGAVAPLLLGSDKDAIDTDIDKAAPAIAGAFNSLSGDKLESLLKKLLTKYENVTVQLDEEEDAERLTEDLANELFCGNAQDMFILAFHVIRVNFSGFFERLGGPSGRVVERMMAKMTSANTESSM